MAKQTVFPIDVLRSPRMRILKASFNHRASLARVCDELQLSLHLLSHLSKGEFDALVLGITVSGLTVEMY